MLDDFHWLRPEWFGILPILFLITFGFARRKLRMGSWFRLIDPKLVPYVLLREQNKETSFQWWLLFLGGLLAVIAMAGPSWDRIEQPVFRSEKAIVIALDLSRSMDAQDVSPSRLSRARLKILDILNHRKSGQTALVVYSGNSFTVTPLTTDSDTIAALVASLSTDIMPSRGSYMPAAINKGQQLLKQAGVIYGEVIILTDGGSSPAAETAARELRQQGYSLSILGVGTENGAPIPRNSGGFISDNSGGIAISKLDVTGLKMVSMAGGGRYTNLTIDDTDINILLTEDVNTTTKPGESISTDQWQEEGPWILLFLVPLAALSFRRGWVGVFLLFFLPLPESLYAFSWDDLWKTKNQQAQEALKDGNNKKAAELFEDPLWKAVSLYKLGEYSESALKFSEYTDADNLYNFGNSLARMGEFASALNAYEHVLNINSDDEDTKFNYDLVKKLMESNQSQDNQGEEKNNTSQEGIGDQDSEPADASDEDGSVSKNNGEEGSDGALRDQEQNEDDLAAIEDELEKAAKLSEENGEEDEQENQSNQEQIRLAQENQQAMEQWLRRIQNDPGGLLRRKFRYQYQRQGRDQDGNELWPDDGVRPW